MSVLVHRHRSDIGDTPVNAYLLESAEGVIAVDATLTASGGRALRAELTALGKPLAAVVLTHAHPDHYGGLVELLAGDDVPVYATARVDAVIRRDDAIKESILRPMFGDEWPHRRRFPDTVVDDGETISAAGIALTVTDLGPGESPADSVWALAEQPACVFSGDVGYDATHCYLADGFYAEWLANLERLRGLLPPGTTLHPGHGEPAGLELLDRQRTYIETLLDAVRRADWDERDSAQQSVAATMRQLLPTDTLAFLMQLSIVPLADRLGVMPAPAA